MVCDTACFNAAGLGKATKIKVWDNYVLHTAFHCPFTVFQRISLACQGSPTASSWHYTARSLPFPSRSGT